VALIAHHLQAFYFGMREGGLLAGWLTRDILK
jgi:hypothetical protein